MGRKLRAKALEPCKKTGKILNADVKTALAGVVWMEQATPAFALAA